MAHLLRAPKSRSTRHTERHRQLYKDWKWRNPNGAVRRWLKKQMCVRCLVAGRSVQAYAIDHIKPHRGNKKLFWDRTNWQPLCKSCHDQKTARGL